MEYGLDLDHSGELDYIFLGCEESMEIPPAPDREEAGSIPVVPILSNKKGGLIWSV